MCSGFVFPHEPLILILGHFKFCVLEKYIYYTRTVLGKEQLRPQASVPQYHPLPHSDAANKPQVQSLLGTSLLFLNMSFPMPYP